MRVRKSQASSCVVQREQQVLNGRRERGSRMAVSKEIKLTKIHNIFEKHVDRRFTFLEESLGYIYIRYMEN